jgi:hypothetical protein
MMGFDVVGVYSRFFFKHKQIILFIHLSICRDRQRTHSLTYAIEDDCSARQCRSNDRYSSLPNYNRLQVEIPVNQDERTRSFVYGC